MKDTSSLQIVDEKIHTLRGHKVILAHDLAALYGVPTKRLNEQVRRNRSRFPADFVFLLTQAEIDNLGLRSQIATSNSRSQIATLKRGQNIKYLPYAFTEQGLAMLSGILNSDKAIEVNIAIMRAFVFIRQYALSHIDLSDKLKALEAKYDKQFGDVYEAMNYLLQKDHRETEQKQRKRIGFKTGIMV